MSADLTVELDDHVAILEVHRPPTNYFDLDVLRQLADAGNELAAGGDCRVIVLASEGKHFCAGANFGEGDLGDARVESSRAVYTEAARIFDVELPIVAAVQGSAVGGGLGLACAADFRVAAASSRFHANFSALGFHHGFALSVTLPRLVGEQKAAEMLYTSCRLTGSEAYSMGLVDRLVDEGQVRAEAMAFARSIAKSAPLAVRSMRQTLRAGMRQAIRVALERELSEQAWLWKTEDCAAGIEANLARRTAVFQGR